MRQLNSKDLIRILPFEKEFRNKLLSEYDSYEEGKKFEVTKVLWESFDELYEAIKKAKSDTLTKEVADGTRHLTSDISEIIDQEVWDDIEARLQKDPEADESLLKIRDKLQHLIKEN